MPVLKGSGSPVLGLDIGSNYIKIVEARLSKDRAVVTALGVMPTPSDTVDNNVILDPVGLGAAIRKLLDQCGVKTKKVVSTIASQSSLVVRIIPVPKMSRSELEETMKWEVERHVPFQPGEIIRDFQPLTRPEDVPEGGQMEVLLAVAQDGFVNQHVAALKAAGLEPVAIDIQPLALSRALLDLANGDRPTGEVAVVNLGANVSEIDIYRNGTLAFTRALPLAGNTFTRAISELMGAPLDMAERLKKEHAHVPEGAQIASDTDFGGDFDFGAPADNQTVHFGQPQPGPLGRAGSPGAAAPAGDMLDFAGGGFGSAAAGGFRDTTEGPVFDLGASPDDELEAKPRQVFDLTDTAASRGAHTPPANPFADTQFANPFDLTGETHVVPANTAPVEGDDALLRQQIADAITPVLGELVTELRRSLDYYRSRGDGPGAQRIILCGGTASLPGLGPFLSAQLGLPVELANPLANVQLAAKVEPGYAAEVAPVFPVSLGLAVREMLVDAPARRGGKKR
jgi:type IV pilus assembly protein PilM